MLKLVFWCVLCCAAGLRPPSVGRATRVVCASSSSSSEDGGGGGGAKGFAKPSPKRPRPPQRTASADDDGKSPLLRQLIEDERQRKETLARDVADLKERDAYVRSTADAGRVPDAVANRMGARMALFGGLPTFGGIALFVYFYFSATQRDSVVEPGAVAAFTTLPWVAGLLGIGYGALSASWDEDAEGSLLGLDEFKTNIGRILEGLTRSARDAKLRESLGDDD
mmetsp:Transcript_24262/g.96223  ORF Transcript_24262/g.96223 Transcript_24262/m.96223 type:complete len:224 (+) Transcript_24262:52-723(+)